ncbi:8-amino-7-oxononanoate synthase [Candidatus Magnetomorum sp. HK-1]|nr:8-amino-7-oxononanoate synthase [Candidatus Magnetomorum sp. HK-1]
MSPQVLPSDQVSGKKVLNEGVIFSDNLNHRCIIDGILIAVKQSVKKVKVVRYKHNNVEHLEQLLSNSDAERKLIVTDGIFSLHGHIAPLDKIAVLAKRYNAMVYVDDAHATGVLGENGGGTGEHFDVNESIDIQMGTFSKALGGAGGFVVANSDIIEYLRYQCATYVFQTAMPPGIAAGLKTVIEIIKSEYGKKMRVTLKENAEYLRQQLNEIGYNTVGSKSHIIPIFIGDKEKAASMASFLKDANILSFAYYYPAVPQNEAIIRVNLMAQHTKEHINHFLNVMNDLRKKNNLI